MRSMGVVPPAHGRRLSTARDLPARDLYCREQKRTLPHALMARAAPENVHDCARHEVPLHSVSVWQSWELDSPEHCELHVAVGDEAPVRLADRQQTWGPPSVGQSAVDRHVIDKPAHPLVPQEVVLVPASAASYPSVLPAVLSAKSYSTPR